MSINFERLLNPIKRKLFLLIGRALITAVNEKGESGFYPSGDRKDPQRVDVDWYGTLRDLEHPEPFGFAANPVKGTSEAIILSPDGSRSNAIVIMVQDTAFRPNDLPAGGSVQYDDSDGRHTIVGGKHAIGKKDTPMTSTPPAADTELLELCDRILTVLQGTLTLPGDTTGTTFVTAALAELAKIQADLGNIKGSL